MAVEVDGRVYIPAMALDGTPLAAARRAMKVQAILNGLRIEGIDRVLRERAERHGLAHSSVWTPIVHEEEFGFVNQGVFVPYGSLQSSSLLG